MQHVRATGAEESAYIESYKNVRQHSSCSWMLAGLYILAAFLCRYENADWQQINQAC
jgi:hypothetical protein